VRRAAFGFMTALAALATGCLNTGPTEATLGEEFELSPNQSARIAGSELTVGFRRVVGDNRCPIDVFCLVEGRAGIDLDVFGTAATNPVRFFTPLPASWDDGTYQIKVLELLPNPTASRAIKPEDYRVRLVVQLLPGPADLARDTE